MASPICYIQESNAEKVFYNAYLSSSTSNHNERTKMKKMLLKAIDHELTDLQRYCLVEHYFNGKKQKEIAEELGVNSSTISRHVTCAKEKLKRIAQYY